MNTKNSQHHYLIKTVTVWGIIFVLILAIRTLRRMEPNVVQTAAANTTTVAPKKRGFQGESLENSNPSSIRRDYIKSSDWPEGLRVYRDWWKKRQAAVTIIEMDRTAKNLSFGVALANDRIVSRERISDTAKRLKKRGIPILGGVNGSFGIREDGMGRGGMIFNLHIEDWELVSIPPLRDRWGYAPPSPWGETSFGVTTNGEFLLDAVRLNGVVRINGEELEVNGINQICDSASPVVIYTPRFGPRTLTRRDLEITLKKLQLPVKGKYKSTFVIDAINPDGNSTIPSNGVVLALDRYMARKWQSKFEEGRRGELEIALSPAKWQQVPDGIGGNIRLLRDGEVEPELVNFHRSGGSSSPNHGNGASHHPRSALGFNDDKLFLMVVDGRQHGYSMGMTFYQMGDFFRDLGVKNAINFDGGSSSTLWGLGGVINRPSHGYERRVFNVAMIRTRKGEK